MSISFMHIFFIGDCMHIYIVSFQFVFTVLTVYDHQWEVANFYTVIDTLVDRDVIQNEYNIRSTEESSVTVLD